MKLNLKHYSALAAAFIAVKNESDGQILYTDIKDTVLSANDESYSLDLNNDGIADFKINFESSSHKSFEYYLVKYSINIKPLNGNKIFGNGYRASALDCGFEIGKHGNWINGEALLASYRYFLTCASDPGCTQGHLSIRQNGYWGNAENRFCGLQLISNGDTLFGWVRMDISVKNECVIKDYAYQKTQGKKLEAGKIDCSDVNVSFTPVTKACGDADWNLSTGLPTCLSYQWYWNGAPVPGAKQPDYTTADSGQYFVVVKDGGNCIDTSNTTIAERFGLPPKPKISQHGDTLTTSLSSTYQWYSDYNKLTGATSRKFFPAISGNIYEVSITDSNGCFASSYLYPFCAEVEVKAGNTQLGTYDVEICQGSSIKLSIPTDSGKSYNWFQNDSYILNANSASFTTAFSGIYYCQIQSVYATCKSDSIDLEYLAQPTITQTGDSLISSIEKNYQWLLDFAGIAGATSQGYVPAKSGHYSVEVQGDNGCDLPSQPINFIFTSSNQISPDNPPHLALIQPRLLQIKFFNEDFLNGKIKILNALGQPIKELTIDKNTIEIPFAENESGWFIVDIEKDEKRFHSPILIF